MNKDIAEYGKGTRFPINDPTLGGRKPSIKKQLSELLLKDGEMVIEAENVISINEDGGVTINLPTQMQIAIQLQNWALSNKGNDSIKAIQLIMETLDGKPKQSMDLTTGQESTNKVTYEFDFRMRKKGEGIDPNKN
jgi:hypothetical protein